MSSTIRVFVQWKDSTVFAGEDVECTITFKNVATPNGQEKPPSPRKQAVDRHRKLPPVHSSTRPSISRNSSFGSQAPPPHIRGHRPALSLTTPSNGGDRRSPALPAGGFHHGSGQAVNRHQRSVSIMSLGTDGGTEASHERAAAPRRPKGHGRSASLQVVPGRSSPFGGSSEFLRGHTGAKPSPIVNNHRFPAHSSPITPGGSSPPTIQEPTPEFSLPVRPSRRNPGVSTAPNPPSVGTAGRKASGSFSQNFRFPAAPASNERAPERPESIGNPTTYSPQLPGSGARSPDEPSPNPNLETLSPVARILSGSSMNGTPRSSGEFYSMSNNSTETMASEYVSQPTARLLPRPFHQRQGSQLAPRPLQTGPETLMMGYAQIMGNFTVDGSLINQAPFEEVKRKGVVGGQGGGGVVGVERKTRESGLFGALGWGNIGESIGGLLGTAEPSSIREMRGIASSKTIPLITTPQSILFVDLRLDPGESRSYTYSFTLPRGLPPTHKGRSIKVAYHLTIGTQRPGSARTQQVKHVDIPFRVFGSVNSRGEMLGHDLMSPYIILRDQARTQSIGSGHDPTNGQLIKRSHNSRKGDDASFDDFLEYVGHLLERPRQNSSPGLLSPTDAMPGHSIIMDEPQTMKEAIDLAILRSNLTGVANQSANRFEIARSGRRVAVIMLARPSYRLGETISAVLDFTNTDIPCYSVHVSLETSEKVDPAIALRSNASIYRVTRKVHAAFSENALFAQRLSFSPTIPPNATPEFITSGISLEWKLRVEFITPRLTHEDSGEEIFWDDLLEEISSDDRGVILAATERLSAESFEVQVPIRVYGAVTGAPDVAVDEEGLPV